MNMESFLECSIQSIYPHPHITWKMDNTDVSEESNSKITGIAGPFHIKSMLNITGSNSSFECTIENSLLSQTWRGKWTFSGRLHWAFCVQVLCQKQRGACRYTKKQGKKKPSAEWIIWLHLF